MLLSFNVGVCPPASYSGNEIGRLKVPKIGDLGAIKTIHYSLFFYL